MLLLSGMETLSLISQDIRSIIQEFGFDNDSLLSEKYDVNTVEWEIMIQVRHVGGSKIWP